jgi:RND superfamily putative drug exporter
MSAPLGPIGRLGAWTATHFRAVAIAWAVVLLGLGFFAPKVEHALSGAGWEATGSESVEAREQIDREFEGLSSSAIQVVVSSEQETVEDEAFRTTLVAVEGTLAESPGITRVIPPKPGASISEDGRTAVVQGAAGGDPNDMVRVADDLKEPLAELGGEEMTVSLTGSSGMW